MNTMIISNWKTTSNNEVTMDIGLIDKEPLFTIKLVTNSGVEYWCIQLCNYQTGEILQIHPITCKNLEEAKQTAIQTTYLFFKSFTQNFILNVSKI